MFGAIEFRVADIWLYAIDVSSFVMAHSDLYGCLFGVNNYAAFDPLFADRGIPSDLSIAAAKESAYFTDPEAQPSWFTADELAAVDWSELANGRDQRVTEYVVSDDGTEREVTKWLNAPGRDDVRAALDLDPQAEVRRGDRVFRRIVVPRARALEDNDFPVLMSLMEVLAARFGASNVRLFAWFGY